MLIRLSSWFRPLDITLESEEEFDELLSALRYSDLNSHWSVQILISKLESTKEQLKGDKHESEKYW